MSGDGIPIDRPPEGEPGRWERAKELLGAALEREPGERDAYLDTACVADPELRREVESLLAAHLEADDFLSRPPTDSIVRSLADDAPDPRLGEALGAYRIERRIGRGGAGTVYLAQRADRQFERQVAIKVIRRGVATEGALARFRSERQILARIDHPNIAQLFDAGTTPDGLPYLVMEYVEGLPIDEYCDRHRLGVDARLALFEAVCAAVQVAHQSLVVHRDLKPGNILVTAEGVPKLLDFGIAKLLDPTLFPDTTDPTRAEHRVMTPEFASPEQIRGEPVTTASDVYSLGVLLYLLLTGRRPLRLAHLGVTSMEELIATEGPPRPSRVAAQADGEVAGARGTRPERLARRLQGDLDTILLQALRKEPERRYGSVEQLADDLRRHRGGLPVRARPDTWSYRARKFVGRHTLPVAVACTVLLLGVAFTATLARQSQRLAQERDRAAAEAAKAAVVAGFLQEILGTADPVLGSGRETTVLGALEEALPRIEPTFADQPDMEAAVRHAIGRTLLGLGRLEEADREATRALELRRALGAPARLEVADSLNLLGEIRYERDRLEEARDLYAAALEIRRELRGPEHVDVARTVDNLANIHHDYGEFAAAETLYTEALQTRRRLLGESHRDIAASLNNLAVLAHDRDRLEEAEALHREALAMTRATLGPVHPDVASSLGNLAAIVHDRGDPEAAEPLYREAVEIARSTLGHGHPGLITSLHSLALLNEDLDRLDEAERLYREALAMAEVTYAAEHAARLELHYALAELLTRRERWDEAEPLYAGLAEVNSRLFEPDDPLALDVAIGHGLAIAHLGDWQRGEAMMLAAYRTCESLVTDEVDPEEGAYLEAMLRDFAGRMARLYELGAQPARAAEYRARTEGD